MREHPPLSGRGALNETQALNVESKIASTDRIHGVLCPCQHFRVATHSEQRNS